MANSIKGWSYEIERGTCSLCGEEDSVLSSVGEAALCESCVFHAAMAWRKVVGEVPPGFPDEDVRKISEISVIVARRSRVPDSEGDASPALETRLVPSAYEFLMVAAPGGGGHTLPTAPAPPGATVRDAALQALDSVGLHSWPALLETLHAGYTPRGRLAAFVLARGYSVKDFTFANPGTWLPWPASAHAGRLAGFYEFLETAWPLRLYRLCVPGDRLPSEVSVAMREVARRYVDLQSAAGSGSGVDTSMLAAYRAAMTADELALAEVVGKFEEGERKCKSVKRLPAVPPEGGGESGGERRGEVGAESSPAGDDAGGDSGGEDPEGGGAGDAGDDPGEQPPEPGFARSFPRR